MKLVMTKIPDRDYEKFRELCQRRGMTVYECVKFLVYRFLQENGYDSPNTPVEIQVRILRKQVEELSNRVSQIESELRQLTRPQGAMDRFMKRR